jgi:hypothetical protein
MNIFVLVCTYYSLKMTQGNDLHLEGHATPSVISKPLYGPLLITLPICWPIHSIVKRACERKIRGFNEKQNEYKVITTIIELKKWKRAIS